MAENSTHKERMLAHLTEGGWRVDNAREIDMSGPHYAVVLEVSAHHCVRLLYSPRSRDWTVVAVYPHGVKILDCELPVSIAGEHRNISCGEAAAAVQHLPDVVLLQAQLYRRLAQNPTLEVHQLVQEIVKIDDWGRPRLFAAVGWLLAGTWDMNEVTVGRGMGTVRLVHTIQYALRKNAERWVRHEHTVSSVLV